MKAPPYISVAIPIFRCESCLDELVARLEHSLALINNNYEIIFVDDGSPDRSWEKICLAVASNPRIIGIQLIRNFGQHQAIAAALDKCRGDWVVVMDGDLQDRPEEIYRLHEKATEGFDVVLARRNNRKDPLFKKICSNAFYRVLSFLGDVRYDPAVGNFGIYHRKVIAETARMKEHIRYFPAMIQWLGFPQASIEVEHGEGTGRKSAYNLRRLVQLASNVILCFSDRPLRVAICIGLTLCVASFAYAVWIVRQALLGQIAVLGWASLMASTWMLAGLTIFLMGIIGLYVGQIFAATKQRPVYVIRQATVSPD